MSASPRQRRGAPTGPKDPARREARRRELLSGAVAALARHGPGATMDQMAAESGVTKPILYRHFGDQRGLSRALADFYLQELREALDLTDATDLRGLLREQLDAGLRVVERHPGLYEYITTERSLGGARDDDDPPPEDWFHGFIARICDARGVDAEAAGPIASALGGALGNSTLWWIRQDAMSRERFVDWVVAMLWDGLDALLAPSDD